MDGFLWIKVLKAARYVGCLNASDGENHTCRIHVRRFWNPAQDTAKPNFSDNDNALISCRPELA